MKARVLCFLLFVGPEKGRFDDGYLVQLVPKVTTIGCNTRLQSFPEREDGFVDLFLRQVSPDTLKHDLQFSLGFGLWCEGLVLFEHCTPDMIVEWIKIRRVRRPFVLVDELRCVLLQPILRKACTVSGCSSC